MKKPKPCRRRLARADRHTDRHATPGGTTRGRVPLDHAPARRRRRPVHAVPAHHHRARALGDVARLHAQVEAQPGPAGSRSAARGRRAGPARARWQDRSVRHEPPGRERLDWLGH